MGGARPRRRGAWTLLATGLAGLLLLNACTYESQEPGLFRTTAPSRTPEQRPPLERPNPDLPVAGESTWTTADGSAVTVRFAVHAVRRMQGATVLDWSVTPVSAPGVASGDDLPGWMDLGLTRESEGGVNIVLLDSPNARAYRPLSHRQRRQFSRCLCSPLWVAQLSMRIGETRLLQVTYPSLPASTQFVDVYLMNSIPFWHVPVTPEGQVPTALRPTDLTRPAEPLRPASASLTFEQPVVSRKRVSSFRIHSVVRSERLTAMQWTLTSVTDQVNSRVYSYEPPVTAEIPTGVGVINSASASGPQLRAAGPGSSGVLEASFMTAEVQLPGYFECLCSRLGVWSSSIRQAGGKVTVLTNFPALPSTVATVDVVLPRAGTIAGVPVVPASDSARRLGPPVPSDSGQWTYATEDPMQGWAASRWPTPLPAVTQLPDYRATVERIAQLPKG